MGIGEEEAGDVVYGYGKLNWIKVAGGKRKKKQGNGGIKKAFSDSKTIIWNGSMGVFESSQFAGGIYDIAVCLAELPEENGATTIIGGGASSKEVREKGVAPISDGYGNTWK